MRRFQATSLTQKVIYKMPIIQFWRKTNNWYFDTY
jgi:hypothetical protein